MPKILTQVFELIGQRALEKSRAYYYLPRDNSEGEEEDALSEVAFAAMLKEIDAFSEQFQKRERANETYHVK